MDTLELHELEDITKSTNHVKLICINNELHKIGGFGIHTTWKIEENSLKYEEIHKIDEQSFRYKSLSNPGVIYLKSRKCMLLFYSKSIYRFSITDKKWEKLQIKIPKALFQSAIVKTKDERFVIVAGTS